MSRFTYKPHRSKEMPIEEETSYVLNYCTVKMYKTNVGKMFIKLIHKHFPPSSTLYKIFSRNTLNISYSYTNNITIIKKTEQKNKQLITYTNQSHL